MNRFVSSKQLNQTMKRNFTAKSLFLLLAITVASLTAQAQIEWGIMGGPSMSNLSVSGYKLVPDSSRPSISGITRFRVSLFMDMPLNNYWSFSPELAYSVKGGVQKLDSAYTVFTVPPGWTDKFQTVSNFDFGYIEIPLLFRFSTPLGRKTALYPYENSVKPFYLDLFGGPYLSYLMSGKNDASATWTRSSTNDTTAEYNFAIKTKTSSNPPKIGKLDYGIVAGMGIKWRFNRKSYLYLDVRYTIGMANINKGYWNRTVQSDTDPTQTKTESPKVKNAGTFSFALGYITNFSKRRYFNLVKPDKNRP